MRLRTCHNNRRRARTIREWKLAKFRELIGNERPWLPEWLIDHARYDAHRNRKKRRHRQRFTIAGINNLRIALEHTRQTVTNEERCRVMCEPIIDEIRKLQKRLL